MNIALAESTDFTNPKAKPYDNFGRIHLYIPLYTYQHFLCSLTPQFIPIDCWFKPYSSLLIIIALMLDRTYSLLVMVDHGWIPMNGITKPAVAATARLRARSFSRRCKSVRTPATQSDLRDLRWVKWESKDIRNYQNMWWGFTFEWTYHLPVMGNTLVD